MASKPAQEKRKVIVITDGDKVALRAVQEAAHQVGARVISRSAGNPTPLTGKQIIALIHQAPYDPVLVTLDDNGHYAEGSGEKALRHLLDDPTIDIMGAIAVASNTEGVEGAQVDFSVDQQGNLIADGVDKNGVPQGLSKPKILGDTVDALNDYQLPVVVGVGDIGKMDGKDSSFRGAPVTTTAIIEILKRNGLSAAQIHPK